MATTGSVDVNLDNVKDIINNTTSTGAEITSGISSEGSLMGTAVGITIAILLLVGMLTAVLGIIFLIFTFAKRLMNTRLR